MSTFKHRLDVDVAKKIAPFLPSHNYGYPAWSPDGKKVVVQDYQPNAKTQLRIMNADGSNPQSVPFSADTYLSSFVRTLDNTQITFLANSYEVKDNIFAHTKEEIDSINAGGTNLQMMVDLGIPPLQLITALPWGMLP